jgi:hypothetical protein
VKILLKEDGRSWKDEHPSLEVMASSHEFNHCKSHGGSQLISVPTFRKMNWTPSA